VDTEFSTHGLANVIAPSVFASTATSNATSSVRTPLISIHLLVARRDGIVLGFLTLLLITVKAKCIKRRHTSFIVQRRNVVRPTRSLIHASKRVKIRMLRSHFLFIGSALISLLLVAGVGNISPTCQIN